MESGAITDGQISASSIVSDKHAAVKGRLNTIRAPGSAGAWAPDSNSYSGYHWLQVNLGGQNMAVTRIATQGRNGDDEWVKFYKLQYSNDDATFHYYREEGQTIDKVK